MSNRPLPGDDLTCFALAALRHPEPRARLRELGIGPEAFEFSEERAIARALLSERAFTGATTQVSVESVEAVGGEPLDIRASAEFPSGINDVIAWLADGAAPEAEPGPVAVVVTSALAAHLGIVPGDTFEFRYAGSGRRGEAVVSSITDLVPGASSALAFFAPLENVLVSQLQRDPSFVAPNSVWAGPSSASRNRAGRSASST